MNQSEMIRADGMKWKNIHLSPSKIGTWLTCTMMFYYNYIRRIPRKSKVFFPQGTVIHYAVELLQNDLAAGKEPDYDYYLMKMEECWLDELSKEGGEIYDNKGNILTTMQLSKALAECERWFTMYYMAAKNNEIPDFDPSCVKETELDIMREVVHYKHGPLGVSLRGKVDWAIDLDGPVAKLADLKTASTHWMGRWGQAKADAQLQCTTYGYITGKDTEFSYVVIPKASEKDKNTTKIEHYKTSRNKHHYMKLEDVVYNFLIQTDVLNNYEGFVPYPNPKPSATQHCDKLCDFKQICFKENFA